MALKKIKLSGKITGKHSDCIFTDQDILSAQESMGKSVENEKSEFKFVPQIGMKTDDCFLHGIGENEDIINDGVIEFVGRDYFILRNTYRDKPIFVSKDSYPFIEESDFTFD